MGSRKGSFALGDSKSGGAGMTHLVKGSLSAIAHQTGISLAESFLNVDALIIVDISSSMDCNDVVREGRKVTRWTEAKRQLELLQNSLPGRVALVAFSDAVSFCPSGFLPCTAGSTDMVAALQFVKVVDNCGVRLILISDGEPNNPNATLKLASQFKSHIDVIHIGAETDTRGREFLRKLASLTGGVVVKSSAAVLPELKTRIQALLNGD